MPGKTLSFGAVQREPDVRMLDEMRSLLLDKEFAREAGNRPLYYMYRDLYKQHHRERIEQHEVRYDITVIPAARLGREHVKTKGHYHPEAARGVAYPEIYEVIAGTAHYLLQKQGPDGGITDVVVVEAEAGDKVIIPPGYGHITINPGDTDLKMANWVSTRFESEYGAIEDNGGGAYYETISGDWVKNHKYDDLPQIRFAEPQEVPDLKITNQRGMYKLIHSPDNLAFLNRPHKFQWVFEDLY